MPVASGWQGGIATSFRYSFLQGRGAQRDFRASAIHQYPPRNLKRCRERRSDIDSTGGHEGTLHREWHRNGHASTTWMRNPKDSSDPSIMHFPLEIGLVVWHHGPSSHAQRRESVSRYGPKIKDFPSHAKTKKGRSQQTQPFTTL